MSVDEIIEGIIEREGPFNNRPEDKGGPTCWGIAKRFHPEAWVNGPPTKDVARAIYRKRYIIDPGFAGVKDIHLQEQLIDFGVNSGPATAIKFLQKIAGVPDDGILGPHTLDVVNALSGTYLNNRLMVERLRMVGRIIAKDKSQAVFANGWIVRFTEFLR